MQNRLCPIFNQSETSASDRHESLPETYMLAALLERAIRDLDLDNEPLVRNYAIQWFKPPREVDQVIKPTILFTWGDVKSYLRLSKSRLDIVYARVKEAEYARDNGIIRNIEDDENAAGLVSWLRRYHHNTRRQC